MVQVTTRTTETIIIRYTEEDIKNYLLQEAGPGFNIVQANSWDAEDSVYKFNGYVLTKVTETK